MSPEVDVVRVPLERERALPGGTLPPARHWSLSIAAIQVAVEDVRSRGEILIAWRRGEVVGYAPVWWYSDVSQCFDVARSSADLVAALGDRPVYVAGSRQQMAGEPVIDERLSDEERVDTVRAIRDAANTLLPEPVVFPFICASHPLSDCSPSLVFPGPSRYWLEPLDSRGRYLTSLPRSHRGVLTRDFRDFDRSALHITAGRPELGDRHCDLVSQIKFRHGIVEPPLLVRWRLHSWLRSVDQPIIWTVQHRDGDIVAFAIGNVSADHQLELYEVGVDWSHAKGHLAYIGAMFLGPLSTAWAAGASKIDLGFDSGTPKKVRGAQEEGTSHLLFDGDSL